MIRSARIVSLLCFGLASSTLSANAQTSARFSTLRFQPAIAPINYFTTEGGQVLPHFSPSAGLVLSYANTPLEFDGVAAIEHQLQFNLLVAVGLWDRAEIGVNLPVAIHPSGNFDGGGLGDLQITPKGRIVTRGPFSLALAVPIDLPTGDRNNFLGNTGAAITPKLIFDFAWDRFRFAINGAYRVRTAGKRFVISNAQTLSINDEVVWGGGAAYALMPDFLSLIIDSQFAIGVEDADAQEFWGEAWIGARLQLPYGISVNLGGGPGFGEGPGTPAFRIFAGFAWYKEPDKDADGDGIVDKLDKCPSEPEDKDGDHDEDGCPEDDPPPPPPPDTDGDGILDKDDKCPKAPEDKDQFEDQDGCPDLDNDKDKIPDKDDKCPNKAEDPDKFEDEDGCPDLDNDKDGISDALDLCPFKPETKNGFKDKDGCPDQLPKIVKKFTGAIRGIKFALGKAKIRRTSRPTLDAAAKVLTEYKSLRLLIRGHTDSTGSMARNMELSGQRAAAVKAYLVGKGIDETRLSSEGVGPNKPIADNKTRAGRAENRRIEFILVK